jgi:hypothetical protein
MVHALDEIHRTLVEDGNLIDLRPIADRWPVEVLSENVWHKIGRLTDLPVGLADDKAANNAMKSAARKGWFFRRNEQTFPLYYYWDTPEEMKAHLQETWADFVQLENDIYIKTQSAFLVADVNHSVRVKLKMVITNWQKR